MMPRAPSMRAWAREAATSCGHRRRSTASDALSRSNASAGPAPKRPPQRRTSSLTVARTASSAPQTRSTWASVISGKKGSAIVDALIASVTGNSPGPWPWASW